MNPAASPLAAGGFVRVLDRRDGGSTERRLPQALRWLIGVLALLAAACAPERKVEISIPVRAEGIPEGFVLQTEPPHIAVTLQGRPAAIESLLQQDRPYPLDLDGIPAGRHRFPVSVKRLSLPPGLTVLDTEPKVLEVVLEKELTKRVPVSLSFIGSPPEGYRVAGSQVTPETVELRGPQTVLAPIRTMLTKPIDLTGRTEPFRKETALEVGGGIQVRPPDLSIRAAVNIAEERERHRLDAVPVEGIGAETAFTVTPPAIDLEVRGPVRSLEKLSQAEGFRVYVDLEGLQPGVYVRRATIELPVGIQLVHARPELFTVTVGEEPRM